MAYLLVESATSASSERLYPIWLSAKRRFWLERLPRRNEVFRVRDTRHWCSGCCWGAHMAKRNAGRQEVDRWAMLIHSQGVEHVEAGRPDSRSDSVCRRPRCVRDQLHEPHAIYDRLHAD